MVEIHHGWPNYKLVKYEGSPYFNQCLLFSFNCSCMGNDNQDNLHFAWDLVAAKLLDSLYAREQAVNVSDRLSGINEDLALHRSSLRALAELPRIRCLWTCFNWLRKEAGTVCTVTALQSYFSLFDV